MARVRDVTSGSRARRMVARTSRPKASSPGFRAEVDLRAEKENSIACNALV